MRSRRDLLCRRRLQLLDRLGRNRGWLRELSEYYRGLTIEEFWVRYTLGRMDAATLWERKPRPGEADYRWGYFERPYKLFWVPGLPRPLTRALVEAAGARVIRVLDEVANRPVGGLIWPLVRADYHLFGVRSYIELVAAVRGMP